jgi:hypothetical protein
MKALSLGEGRCMGLNYLIFLITFYVGTFMSTFRFQVLLSIEYITTMGYGAMSTSGDSSPRKIFNI